MTNPLSVNSVRSHFNEFSLSLLLILYSFLSIQYYSNLQISVIPYRINISLFEKGNDEWIRHCRNMIIVLSINYRQSLSSVILIIVNHHYSSFYNTSFFDHQFFSSFCSQFNSEFDYLFIGPKEDSITEVREWVDRIEWCLLCWFKRCE